MSKNQLQAGESQVRLIIADVIIELKSLFKMESLNGEYDWRFKNFVYEGNKHPEINLDVEIRAKAPLFRGSKRVFKTSHPLDRKTNWSLFKKEDGYIIRMSLSDKKQYAALNKDFSKGKVYLSLKESRTWKLGDVIYDLLQIILINYFSHKQGIFVHSIGLKDFDKKGLLFVGPSGSGKSTTARLWHKHTKAKVLNDDRVVIRKIKNSFYIFGTPWHGDFRDYLKSSSDGTGLTNVFFIYHDSDNRIVQLKPKEAFKCLYPNIFPIFWDKQNLEKQVSLCQDLVCHVPSYKLGFINNKSVISVVRLISQK